MNQVTSVRDPHAQNITEVSLDPVSMLYRRNIHLSCEVFVVM